ncbi:MAG: PP2C family protein-serine/threonine phosphatase [Candidatus Sulfotelmatobacter sp.]
MRRLYQELRLRLIKAGLWPEGRLAWLACYLAGMATVLFALQKLLGIFAKSWGEHLGGWVGFLALVAGVLFFVLAFGWVKRRILWRLRNRLIVTYVFIGVIPVVLLLAMAGFSLFLFGGQFASYVVISELNTQLRSAEAVNAAISNELAAGLARGNSPTAESLSGLKKRDRAWGHRQVQAWQGTRAVPLSSEASAASAFSYPAFIDKKDNDYARASLQGKPFHEIVSDHGKLYLRVVSVLPMGATSLIVVTSEPLDKALVGKIAEDLGEITLYSDVAPDEPAGPITPAAADSGVKTSFSYNANNKSGVVVTRGSGDQRSSEVLSSTFTVGTSPQPTGFMDQEIPFVTPLQAVDWNSGATIGRDILLKVRTRPSKLYGHLFAALGEFAGYVVDALIVVAAFFAIIELIALIIGTRMTRTVTAAVAQLHEATKHVDRGDFSHRIPVKSSDQLADLAHSFNSMTASIEKLILEQKEKQRLENELAIAQEVQAQLFPRQVSELESLEVHGFCRPARTVSGDYYDFLTASSHKLILAVGDISGKGISAALLMATIHSAVRAYSVENLPQMREPVAVGAVAGAGRVLAAWPEGVEVSPGALLSLLNHQLYESTPPEKYATLFLGVYDGRSHRLTYSNGGHLPPILIATDGSIRRLEAGGTVVGLFDHMSYAEGAVEMHPGEVFLAYSDGVTEPENDFGEFGEQRLIDLVRDNRELPLPEISQIVTLAVENWIGDNEQPDDVTLVLARAR